jgi:hypothetical protein
MAFMTIGTRLTSWTLRSWVGLLLAPVLAMPAVQAGVYDFEGLDTRFLAGQDGWLSEPSLGEVVIRLDDSAVNGTQVAQPDVGLASGWFAYLTRVNDASFAFGPFAGGEAALQFDTNAEAASGLALGHDGDGDGLLSRSAAEIGPVFGTFRDSVRGVAQFFVEVAGTPGAGSDLEPTFLVPLTDVDPSNDPEDWYRLLLRIDLAANGGAGSGSLYYMNLTEGDTEFQPVAGLQNLALALDTLAPEARPDDWDAMWLVTRFDGNQNVPQIDNLVPHVGEDILVASVLPGARAVQVEATASAFATVINTGLTPAEECAVALPSGLNAEFHFQTTDPLTNALTGTVDTPVAVAAGAAQTFYFEIRTAEALETTDIPLVFECANAEPADPITGVNTFRLTSTQTAIPDQVALAATIDNDGIVKIPGVSGTGVFAVATANVGAAGNVTARVDSGGGEEVAAFAICLTDQEGRCTAPPASSVTSFVGAGTMQSYGVFATALGEDIPLDPANRRAFVRFFGGSGIEVGSTSVAVTTQ